MRRIKRLHVLDQEPGEVELGGRNSNSHAFGQFVMDVKLFRVIICASQGRMAMVLKR